MDNYFTKNNNATNELQKGQTELKKKNIDEYFIFLDPY